VHADDPVGPAGGRAELGDGDGRRVGGEDGFGLRQLVELPEDFGLDFEFFRHGLDDEVGAGERRKLRRRRDAADDVALLLVLQSLLVNVALEAAVDGPHPAFEKLRGHVAQQHAVAGARRHLRDAVAHRPRPDHADCFAHLFALRN
jgi:hypothetical protein